MPDAPNSLLNRPRWMPDLLATRAGRFVAFFFLYMAEGIPWGFSATAVVLEMKQSGMSTTEVGFFMGMLSAPWAWKWAIAPVVDLVSSERLGRRRAWIVAMQTLMALTLLASAGVDFTEELRRYTILILLVNAFSATQDVAIDALACSTLKKSERGTANGLMFAGNYLGTAIGGAGVIFLTAHIPFEAAAWLIVGPIVLITIFIAIPLREPKTADATDATDSVRTGRLQAIATVIQTYVVQVARAFGSSRGALAAAVIALLPFGTMSLSQMVGLGLKDDLGLTKNEIGTLTLLATIVSAACCVVGGFLSDRHGRRRMLAVYILVLTIPPLVMAVVLQKHGYIMPLDTSETAAPRASLGLLTAFWAISLLFAAFHGLMFGTRTAMFMDVCDPKVAATQFTAYMALLNVTIGYSAAWQGWAIDKFGYPITLTIDAAFGLVCLAVLPFVTPRKTHAEPEQLPAEPQPL